MAEVEFEFKNPGFNRDKFDKDHIKEPETFVGENKIQNTLDNQYKALDNLTGKTREEHRPW